MRIALPLINGRLAMHFGHCERFAFVDVDEIAGSVIKREETEAPPHQPGLLPPWLADRGVKVIIAAGMGQRALQLFAQRGIQVVVGVGAAPADEVVSAYLDGSLLAGQNLCDH